jgi:KTSC domain
MAWSQSVFSSMITDVGWNDESEELLVTFKNGRTAAYKGLTEDKAHELANAASVGSMFNSEIKNFYPFRYV